MVKFRAYNKASGNIYPVLELWFKQNNVHPNTPPGALLDIGNNKTVFCEFDVIILMQSTNREDKNNEEIYGDDICKIKLRNGHERIGIIEWVDKDCGYHLQVFKATDGETGSHCVSYSGSAVEGSYIIGNKHQNPKLLK